MLEQYLQTHDHQIQFKSQHATDMCIFTVKSVIKYYTKQNSAVFKFFLDAAKAFDRVSHWTLFSKMIKKNVPMVIVRVIAFWYQTQPMCIKWGKANSEYFNISKGVRQSGVLWSIFTVKSVIKYYTKQIVLFSNFSSMQLRLLIE